MKGQVQPAAIKQTAAVPAPRSRPVRLASVLANGLRYSALTFAALVILFPVVYALIISLENAAESVAYPPVFIPT